ncbi:hypothetical protein [Streptomyces sp. NRRL B-24484]|uniref:hypothetical protein n=1 Tax=Streptomyces sp. NRRL B-24484 TaxID=1463833 RepID=UPI0004BF63BB|nr:hypothetical protein [Streptomyces sp. NRRL B-24484]
MNDRQVDATISDDQFDLDIRVKVVTKAVDRFSADAGETASCASTCGDECTNSCASTCGEECTVVSLPAADAAGETETCSTCGSCTSECDTVPVRFYEDHYVLEVSQVRADGITRRVAGEHVVRRVEREPRSSRED